MIINTKRLLIMPLTHSQLKKRIGAQNEFAKETNLLFVSEKMSNEEIEAVKKTFLPALGDNSKEYLFYTMWLIIEKKERIVVGGICFHGGPDEKGVVEIGYGTEPYYQQRGFMKETILAILEWLKTREDVKLVMAETELYNLSSVGLLKSCGFTFSGNKNGNAIYKISLK